MKREVYYRGKPGKKYGIWNDVKKEFQFGICEDTPMLAEARLYQKLGDDARKWRFQPRMLPDNHKFQMPDIVSDSVKAALLKMDRDAHGGRGYGKA